MGFHDQLLSVSLGNKDFFNLTKVGTSWSYLSGAAP